MSALEVMICASGRTEADAARILSNIQTMGWVLTKRDVDLPAMKADITLLKWMVGAILACIALIATEIYTH